MRFVIVLTLIAVAAGCATTPAKQAAPVAPAAPKSEAAPAAPANVPQANDAIAAMKTYTFGQSREPLAKVDEVVKDAMQSPEASRAVAQQLAALLSSDATPDAKSYACKKLVFVASEEDVPAIAPLLLDEKLSDMARYAIEPIQGPAADSALIDALGKAPDSAKVGIANSLGMRKTAAARPELEKLVHSRNRALAAAAKDALARIGG
jgi:hypothetical protein